MGIARYGLGALAVVTVLSLARDTASANAIPGTPTPLSIESMRTLADDGCRRPPEFRPHTLQRLKSTVLEVGVTDGQLVICTVGPDFQAVSATNAGSPGDEYFAGRLGLVGDDGVVEVGRIAPGVAVLEFVLHSGQVVKAELYGEIYLCRLPARVTNVRVRAYDAGGRLLRDAEI
jgi:hypothetical protein